jgi:hypothetical protein
MLQNLKPCGECGSPQAIAIDDCPHCTKCESDLFPAGGTTHKDNFSRQTKAQKIPDVPVEENETEE